MNRCAVVRGGQPMTKWNSNASQCHNVSMDFEWVWMIGMKLLPLLLNAAVVKLQAFEKIPLSRTKHHWASLAWAALHSASRTMLLWINLLRSWTSKDSPSTIFTHYSPLGLPTCSKQRMPVALHQPSPVKSTRLLVERPWAKLWMLEHLISGKMGNQLDLEANARWVSGNHLSLHQLCLLFGRVPVSFVCYRSLHSCCTFRFAASSGMAASSSSKQILRATGCFAYAAVLGTTNNHQVWGRTQGFIVWKLTQGVLEPLSVLPQTISFLWSFWKLPNKTMTIIPHI